MHRIKSIFAIVVALVLMMSMGTLAISADDTYEAVPTYDVFPFDTDLVDVELISGEYRFNVKLSLKDELKASNKSYMLEITDPDGLVMFENVLSSDSIQVFDWMVVNTVYDYSAIMLF